MKIRGNTHFWKTVALAIVKEKHSEFRPVTRYVSYR